MDLLELEKLGEFQKINDGDYIFNSLEGWGTRLGVRYIQKLCKNFRS